MKSAILTSALALVLSIVSLAHNRPPVEFVRNNGQWHSNVKFKANLPTGAVFLESGKITYSFIHSEDMQAVHAQHATPGALENLSIRSHAWNLQFLNISETSFEGENIQSHYYNFFLGNDPSKWASNVPSYGSIVYNNLYEGIKLRAHSGQGNFKYDFIVAPNANPNLINWTYNGLEGYSIIDNKIELYTSVGSFTEAKPYAFQVVNGLIVEVPCNYAISNGVLRFEFPEGYDTSRELIIDPELIAATLSGTTGSSNYGHTATFDIEGNIYTGAIAFGAGYPTTPGAYQGTFGSTGWGTDFGLSKISPDGTTLIWASYLGGDNGENPHSLWANDFGELYAYGSTGSPDFPTTATAPDNTLGGSADIVVSKLSADGTQLLGSTYIGGSESDGINAAGVNYGDSYRGEIILDANGKVHIASCTSSTNFPTSPGAFQTTLAGAQDGVYLRLNNTLSILEVSTYIGSAANDMAYGLRTAENGSVFITGMAGAADFPTTAGAYQTAFLGGTLGWGGTEMDGFIVRFNANATQLEKSTFHATAEGDQCFFIDLDADENVFVFGQGGDAMPVVGNVYSNAGSSQFITKFDFDLSEVLIGTVIGTGGANEWSTTDFVPDAFLVDHCNNIYISAYSANSELETTGDALFQTGGFYLAVFTEDLETLEYGTFYTGDHVDGGTSRFDKNGTVYQAVCSGGNFNTTPGAWASTQNGGWDIGVFKIDFDVSGVNSAITAPDLSGCAPYVVQFENFSTGDQFEWSFGDGTVSEEFEPSHTYNTPGVYDVVMIASDSLSCNLADTSSFQITISTPVDYVPSFDFLYNCEDMSITTNNTTGYDFLNYVWTLGDGTVMEGENIVYSYTEPGEYELTLTAIDNGCDSDSSITEVIQVINEVVALIDLENNDGCTGTNFLFENGGFAGEYVWDFGDGSPTESGNSVTHVFDNPGVFTVTLIALPTDVCVGTDTTTTEITIIPAPPINSDFEVAQFGDCSIMNINTTNLSSGDDLTYLWTFDDGTVSQLENPSHSFGTPGTYTIELTITEPTCNAQDSHSIELDVIEEANVQIPEQVFICHYDDAVVITPVEPGAGTTYLWSNGETTPSITIAETGDYHVNVYYNNCVTNVPFTVEVGEKTMNLTSLEFCEGSNLTLSIPYAGGSYYQWCAGDTIQDISVNNEGEYCYEYADENGCIQDGIIKVSVNQYTPSLFIPNAFSPNNDNLNDVFLPLGTDVAEYSMTVFNRWGDPVFQTDDLEKPWDGSYKEGEHYVANEAYSYYITYRGECSSETFEKSGVVVVLR